ncbi:MAG: SPFH domain-containing protein [Proteobacteria bacterium]|nr:SPFH domain-containing protein [Pseudomonadota bacterium]
MSTTPRLHEQPYRGASGYTALAVALVATGGAFWLGLSWRLWAGGWTVTLIAALVLVAALAAAGLYMLQPNTGYVLTLFGAYRGTDRSAGLRWRWPWLMGQRVSLRVRNLNIAPLKVNDRRGNPIEIGAVVVWRVQDTAQALFEVDAYEQFVKVQAEAAVRELASQYAYDHGDDDSADVPTLRGSQDEVGLALMQALQARFDGAGVQTLEARLSHLAYAPEIAQVMLRRQQAEAVVSARTKIVKGAVGMVEQALLGLSERGLVALDDERKAAMVSNLLVVLCADREAQPVVNTGTLYN